jgi:hypothetical protein
VSGNKTITGGCLCGAFRYEIDQVPKAVCACHCTDCQRLTGSAFSMAILVPESAWRSNEANLIQCVSVTASGGRKSRWLCKTCKTWVFGGAPRGKAPAGSIRFIQAGTLDDTSWLRPTVHFWTRSAQAWVAVRQGDSQFETQPSELAKWVQQHA